jgi:RNA polymerase sigma-70 factor (ECF subfamily)
MVAGLEASTAAPDRKLESEEDEALVERARQGDEFAFQVLYDRYCRRIYRFLGRRLPNRADTEETTQDVFFNVFASIHSYRGEAPFGAWVFGITRRTLAARFKRKRHPTVPLAEGDGEGSQWVSGDATGDPLAAYECRQRLERLEQAMQSDLSEEQRRLVQLHHLQSRSIQEIAAILRKSEDAVKSNLYRARRLLLAR